MDQHREARRVVVVGAGLGGTATAIRLLQFAREPLEIVLLERRAEYRFAGVAYHPEGNHWDHVFNIQAGRMSVFREDVDDFVNWANHEADRAEWPPEWSDVTFTESGPAPRRIYRDYLATRLAQAAREAADGVTLVEADGEAVALAVHSDGAEVVVERANGRVRSRLAADHVVLATGLEQRRPAFASAVARHPAFVANPYTRDGIGRILAVRSDAVVAIVGSLLSAYDSASLLLRRGHTGAIHLISRSGLTLRAYPPDHRHRVLELPSPNLDGAAYDGLDGFVRRLRREWVRCCAIARKAYPDESPAVVTERVFKSWEPCLPEILARVPAADLRALLDRYGSLFAVLRVGVMGHTAGIVDAAMTAGGQVAVTAARVDEVREADGGTLAVAVSRAGAAWEIEADLVISNFGRESNYARAESRLWAGLLARGTAVPHRVTGRGVEVSHRGELVGRDGRPAGSISVVGSPREGDEIVRNGRAGAFTFNLAAIKNHSVEVAATALCRLEACHDDVAAALPVAQDPELDEAIARSTVLEVHRMTARSRDRRSALAAYLERSLATIHELTVRSGGTPVPERALRSAITTAATRRLRDVSVTPRDLRARLGLEHG